MSSLFTNIPLYPICVILLPTFFNINSLFARQVTLKEMLLLSWLLSLSQLTGVVIRSEMSDFSEWLGWALLAMTYLPCTLAGMYYYVRYQNKKKLSKE